MTEIYYLLDNNALVSMTPAQRSLALSHPRCRIPSEVVYEARQSPDHSAIADLAYPPNPSILRALAEVMAALAPGSHDVVDLYKNQGNADPIVITTALHATRDSQTTLVEERWEIVTEDGPVEELAKAFGVPTLGLADFVTTLAGCAGATPGPSQPQLPTNAGT